jgi:heme/copper-type cytochrome/quinol oxidase subunit 2
MASGTSSLCSTAEYNGLLVDLAGQVQKFVYENNRNAIIIFAVMVVVDIVVIIVKCIKARKKKKEQQQQNQVGGQPPVPENPGNPEDVQLA